MNWQAGLKETAKISDPSLRRDMFEVFFQKHFPYFRGTSEERNEAVNKVMEDAGLSEEAKRRLLD